MLINLHTHYREAHRTIDYWGMYKRWEEATTTVLQDGEGEQNKDEDDKAEDEANKEMRDEDALSYAGENQVT